jgi:hypothetical protein
MRWRTRAVLYRLLYLALLAAGALLLSTFAHGLYWFVGGALLIVGVNLLSRWIGRIEDRRAGVG